MRWLDVCDAIELADMHIPLPNVIQVDNKLYVCYVQNRSLMMVHSVDLPIRGEVEVDGEPAVIEYVDYRWRKSHGVTFVGFRPPD